jgi:hypothetical protein
MTDVAAAPVAAPDAAPAPTPNAGKPTFSHPAIPPLRNQPRAEPKPDPVIATPQPPARAAEEPGAAQTQPDAQEGQEEGADGPETYEYFPDDEFDVTINGKQSSVTLAKLLSAYQRGEAANEKFMQAKQAMHRAQDLVRTMCSPQGFIETCKQLQVDPRAIAEAVVLEYYDYEQMTPEQRQMHDFKREKDAWERQQQQRKQTEEQARVEAETRAYQTRFIEAATSTMDRLRVPADPALRAEMIERAARSVRADLQAGYQSTPQEAIADAWDDYNKRLTQHTRALPVDARVSESERAALAAKASQERIRVAQQAPRVNVPARSDDGRFAPTPKPRMDMWNPNGRIQR